MTKLVNGHENYSINEDGTVIHTKTGKIKKAWLGKVGYYYLDLYQNNKSTKIALHRILAMAFIPNPDNKKTVNHIDGDKTNNSLSNLEWATYSENTKHAYDNNLNRCTTKLIENVELHKILNRFLKGETLSEIKKDYGFALTTISNRLQLYTKELGVYEKFKEERKRQRVLRNKAAKQPTTKVKMLDKNTKEAIKCFNSMSEATHYLNKKTSGPISNAITGRAKTAYGYCWERL